MLSLRRGGTLAGAMLGAIASAAVPAAAQEPDDRPTVAVIAFENGAIGKMHDELDPLRVGMVDLVISALAANPRLRVVERERVQAVLAEQNLSRTDHMNKATAVKIGQLLGAHHLVTGTFITDTRGNLRLLAKSVNANTGVIEYTDNVRGKADDILTSVDQLAEKINAGLKLPPMPRTAMGTAPATPTQPASIESQPAQPAMPAAPAAKGSDKLDLRTAVLYSRALSAMDAGQRAQAVENFQAVLVKFPTFGPAKEKLAKLQASSGE